MIRVWVGTVLLLQLLVVRESIASGVALDILDAVAGPSGEGRGDALGDLDPGAAARGRYWIRGGLRRPPAPGNLPADIFPEP